ncbi:6528_t:CDS:2 [Racocetra persica]|uniref:6528_t:CDS:1 n=1 Tax=Racocetra persica TaxID=160502 RepID=A0ACA9MWK2_9GLOM|nr:6528_t:CDS:2 [Racocetra persica]
MSQQNINSYDYNYDFKQQTYPSNTYSTFIPTETNFTQQSLYASNYPIYNDYDHISMGHFGNTLIDDGVISINTDYLNHSNPSIQKLNGTSNCAQINNNYCSCNKLIPCEKFENDQVEYATSESYPESYRYSQTFEQNEGIPSPCNSLVLCQSQNNPIFSAPLTTIIHQQPINPIESLTEEQNNDHISSKYSIKKTSTMIIQLETSPETLKKYETCEEYVIYYEKRCQVHEDGEMETFEEQVIKMDKRVKVEQFSEALSEACSEAFSEAFSEVFSDVENNFTH